MTLEGVTEMMTSLCGWRHVNTELNLIPQASSAARHAIASVKFRDFQRCSVDGLPTPSRRLASGQTSIQDRLLIGISLSRGGMATLQQDAIDAHRLVG